MAYLLWVFWGELTLSDLIGNKCNEWKRITSLCVWCKCKRIKHWPILRNFNRILYILIKQNPSENVICIVLAIFSQPQCDNEPKLYNRKDYRLEINHHSQNKVMVRDPFTNTNSVKYYLGWPLFPVLIYLYIYIYALLYEFCFLWFTNCILLSDDNSWIPGCLWLLTFVLNNTLILSIRCSTIPHLPRCFCPWTFFQNIGFNIGPLYVPFSYSTWIFCRAVSGFATDCPCDIWCRGLTTCLLHVCPPFGNRFLNTSWAVGLTYWIVYLHFFCILTYAIIYVLKHHINIRLYLYFLNILYFFQVLLF